MERGGGEEGRGRDYPSRQGYPVLVFLFISAVPALILLLVLELLLCRRRFEKRNADGVLGFSEVRPHAGLSFFGVVSFLLPRPAQGLAVRQLSPLAPGEPQTLHLPEQLMVQLPHKQPSWSYDTCAIVGNSGRLLHAQHG